MIDGFQLRIFWRQLNTKSLYVSNLIIQAKNKKKLFLINLYLKK
jgi:hypothetical protein